MLYYSNYTIPYFVIMCDCIHEAQAATAGIVQLVVLQRYRFLALLACLIAEAHQHFERSIF